jgi:hypothetical protein
MHIPGKELMRPKSSRFKFTDARRLAYANALRRSNPDHNIMDANNIIADRIIASIGHTVTKTSSNQGKRRRARRLAWAAGDRFAFAA